VLIDDIVSVVSVATATAFLVVSVFILARFKFLSEDLRASSDVGKSLSIALDTRLKKQDEKILDVMVRMEVLQSRVSQPGPVFETPRAKPEDLTNTQARNLLQPRIVLEQKAVVPRSLEPTEKVVLQLLAKKPRTSVEMKVLIDKSREHTARLMKNLFERGLVERNDSKKPFVYQVTEQGRLYFSEA
jgi:hypothetical protein